MNPANRKLARRAFTGLAGSPTATVVEVQPKDLVLLHFCFNQQEGETKREWCPCKQRVSRDEADYYVKQGIADWLRVKNPKTSRLVEFHRAVVVRRIVIDGETLFAVSPPTTVDRRSQKHEQIKQAIRSDARKILEKLFYKGIIPQSHFQVSDDQLEDLFQEKTEFTGFLGKLTVLGQHYLRKRMTAVIVHWWNNILGYYRLNADAGLLMGDADRGTGKLIRGYDQAQIEQFDALSRNFALSVAEFRHRAQVIETDDILESDNVGRRVEVANHKPSFWSGAWDYSTGASPNVDE